MKTRTDLLNFLAERYGLISYLEIGVQDVNQNFNKIKSILKRGVDPENVGLATGEYDLIIHMTSDEYFRQHNDVYPGEKYDLIFIDGLHTAEQVKKDFENALKILSPSGFIVLHDCNPEKEEHTIVPRPTKTGHWNGSCYKFAASVQHPKFTVDIDNGCTVLYGDHYNIDFFIRPDNHIEDITWGNFSQSRKMYLNLISWDEFVRSHS